MSNKNKKTGTGAAAAVAGGAIAQAASAASDFGAAGRITIRTDVPAVAIHVDQGEYLSYELSLKGVSPIFSFVCIHRKIKTDSDFPVGSKYQWTQFQNAGDEDAHDDTYTVGMSFLGAPMTYTLVVNRCDRSGNVVQGLKDKDFESDNPNDFFLDGLRVFSL